LAVSGSLDEAAAVLDAAMAEGAREPDRVADLDSFIAAHVRRAAIAAARSEHDQSRRLLGRLYRYDPSFSLLAEEDSPQLQATLDEIRRQLGAAPPLEAEDLGESCGRADVLIIARPRADRLIDLERFDRCQPRARVTVSATEPDEHALSALGAAIDLRAKVIDRAAPRAKLIAGALLIIGGAALIAGGGYAASLALSRFSNINTGCAPCTNDELARRGDAYNSATIAASVTVPVGAVALVAGGVLTILGVQQRHRAAVELTRGASSAPASPGATLVGRKW
jgi:hypothetical protein